MCNIPCMLCGDFEECKLRSVMKMTKKSTICFRAADEDKKKFQKLYPYSLSRFLIKCMLQAIKNKDFFMKIYFSEV